VPVPQRTDIAGFVGIAERGPLHTPVRVATWHEFQQRFGGFLPYAHLAYAVYAFFANGGQICWVVRVADRSAACRASVSIDNEHRDAAVYVARATDEGTWANNLEVSIQFASLAATAQRPGVQQVDSRGLAVHGIAGFATGSTVCLRQDKAGAGVAEATRRVDEVDALRSELVFDKALTNDGFKAAGSGPIRVQSLEFSLLVWRNDQMAERFDGLATDSAHPRYAPNLVNAGSRLIRLDPAEGRGLPLLPWRGALCGGRDGLRSMTVFDYVGTPQGDPLGLAALATVDEVSLLAIPDLTIQPRPPARLTRAQRRPVDACGLEAPAAVVSLCGTVIDAATHAPLGNVEVSDGFNATTTKEDGGFALGHEMPGALAVAGSGTADLVLYLDGYAELAAPISVIKTPDGKQDVGELQVTPLELPPQLSDEDIGYGQEAMVRQCEQQRDRFALLDLPLETDEALPDIGAAQAWRARFDSAFVALYYPWLRVPDPLVPDAPQGRLMPPSGHVAGIYAATDLAEGVFRPPANRALSWVIDVATALDDAAQGVLNPTGINAIRSFPGRGIRVYGARTLSRDASWRYVTVRRLLSMLEETIHTALQWAVYEPNGPPLWFGVRMALTGLLDSLWRRGAFAGDRPEAAYTVRCDATTTPLDVQAEGRLIAEVCVAPTVPYEFVVLQLGLAAGELRISEV
jgi:hypothetical protein